MTPRRHMPALLLLFVGSGCAALIYEIVWSQLLQLVIGASAISLGVLLGTFMGGMCIGSLAFPRWISAHQHPLWIYGLLELGIGAIGLLIFFGMPLVAVFYGAIGLAGFWGIVLRMVICAICLMPPTLLMGATLPAIARWVNATPQGISWLGFFYGGNIAGAVLGCLLAGFYLLRVHGAAYATGVAVTINLVIGAAAFLLSKYAAYDPGPDADTLAVDPADVASDRENWPIYVAAGLSGMAALAAEVV